MPKDIKETYYEAVKDLHVKLCEGCMSQLEDNERGKQMCLNPECQYYCIER